MFRAQNCFADETFSPSKQTELSVDRSVQKSCSKVVSHAQLLPNRNYPKHTLATPTPA
uniref:Uncharacterized protein n=1 Tax=Siphoviridae sp. ctGkF2 TaxID=2827823 RepID=A0A8S5TKY8_9CAUD|nr:MAG TPA: hypothetical protein [Siphoviridae sp. ctGkF2]